MRRIALVVLVFFAVSVVAQTAKPKDKPAAGVGGTNPKAIFITDAGKLTCTLYQDKVPNAVANFVGLAEGTKTWTHPASKAKKTSTPLYNGTIFHRVIPNFMVQGGDPAGTGSGEIGFSVNDEFSPDLKFDRPGRMAYANSGPNTNGSQFFITEVPYPSLDPCLDAKGCTRGNSRVKKGYGYTIFGQCDDASVELVRRIARRARDERNDRPYSPVRITKVEIVKPGAAPAK